MKGPHAGAAEDGAPSAPSHSDPGGREQGEDTAFMEQILRDLSAQNEARTGGASPRTAHAGAASKGDGASGEQRARTVRVARDGGFRTDEGTPSARAYLPAKTVAPGRAEPVELATVKVSDPRKLPTVRVARDRDSSNGIVSLLDDSAPTLRSAPPLKPAAAAGPGAQSPSDKAAAPGAPSPSHKAGAPSPSDKAAAPGAPLNKAAAPGAPSPSPPSVVLPSSRPRSSLMPPALPLRWWVGGVVVAAIAGVIVVTLAARLWSAPTGLAPSAGAEPSDATAQVSFVPGGVPSSQALPSSDPARPSAQPSSQAAPSPSPGATPSAPAVRKSDRWF